MTGHTPQDTSIVIDRLLENSELIAIALLVVGFIAARLASLVAGYALGALDRRLARVTTTETSILTPRLIALSRAFMFWLVLILAMALAARVLGVGGDSPGLNDQFIGFLPQALVAFVIVVAAHLAGLLAANIVVQLSDNIPADSLAPRALHGTIVVIGVVMGLQHVGVNITFITQLLLLLVAVVGGGLMLAFALGARRHVANLLARNELSRLTIGERIRIDDTEGTVIEISNTAVDVATDRGVVTIPSARFAEVAVLRIQEERGDD